MTQPQPLRIGIIGMGGFAGAHHNAVRELEQSGECRLICACDPNMGAFAERRKELAFEARGVREFGEYVAMLDACRADLDVITVPTPIPLHAPMHRAGVERGLFVYLEKPPTVSRTELDAMLAVEARAPRLTQVAFSYINEPERQALKRRILAGEFGSLRRVATRALWQRSTQYYARANWAGRLMLDGRLVLDSCMGNAMAHLVHSGLFWCGTRDPWAWGEVLAVESELYRAFDIEGADTVFVRATTDTGVEFHVAMSHACPEAWAATTERLVCDRATIDYRVGLVEEAGPRWNATVIWADGRRESWGTDGMDSPTKNMRSYFNYVQGRGERPVTRLIDSRPFVDFNNLAYIAAGRIHSIPASAVDDLDGQAAGGRVRLIRGLEDIVTRFIADGSFPSRQGVAWGAAGGRAVSADLPRLESVVRAMTGASNQ